MARRRKAIARTAEQTFLESALENEKTVECWHYDGINHHVVYRHKPTYTYFSLISGDDDVVLSVNHDISMYPEVVKTLTSQFGEPTVGDKKYSWKKPKMIQEMITMLTNAPEAAPTIDDVVATQAPTVETVPTQSISNVAVLKKREKIVQPCLEKTLSGYLQYAFGEQRDFNFGGFDAEKQCVVYRHKATRAPHHFGVSTSGNCIYFKEAVNGLSREPEKSFIVDIALRLSTTKFEYLLSEKAVVWYVSGLTQKFSELKK